MLHRLSIALGLAGALLVSPSVARAADEGWERLGERQVAFVAERDVIAVPAGEGRFDALRFHVLGNGVEFLDVRATFGNGAVRDIAVREFVPEGGRTRILDLPGETRILRSVEFTYRTRGRPREGRAVVALWGRRVGAGGPPPTGTPPTGAPPTGMPPAGPPPTGTPPSGPPPAQQPPATPPPAADVWVPLGVRMVRFATDRDTIAVTGAEGRFRRIRLQVAENGVEFGVVRVHFGDGTAVDVAVREFVPAGGQTRAIDLPGEARVIRSIELVYSTRGASREGRAQVTVLGLQEAPTAPAANGPPTSSPPPAAPDEAGWERLGSRSVALRTERDTIQVTAADGRFRKIRLQVRGNAVEILDLTVVFGNGSLQDIPVRSVIGEEAWTRVLDLPGNARVIHHVTFTYRIATERPGHGPAEVVLWGKRD